MPADVPATDTTDDTTPPADATPPPAGDNADPAGAEALGDPGKKALDAMKAQRNAERDRRRQLEARIAELETPKGDDTDAEAIKAAAQREADARANARIIKAEIRAAAAGKLSDPADALLYLDSARFEVSADGSVDTEEIGDAIAELITNKPYLAAAQSGPRFEGNGDGGARKASAGPTQLTRAELAGMSPQDIVKAKAEGRLDNLLSGK